MCQELQKTKWSIVQEWAVLSTMLWIFWVRSFGIIWNTVPNTSKLRYVGLVNINYKAPTRISSEMSFEDGIVRETQVQTFKVEGHA